MADTQAAEQRSRLARPSPCAASDAQRAAAAASEGPASIALRACSCASATAPVLARRAARERCAERSSGRDARTSRRSA